MINTSNLFQLVWERKIRFVVMFFLIFTTTYTILYVVDFLPEAPTEEVKTVAPATSVTSDTMSNGIFQAETLEPATTEPLNIDITEEPVTIAPIEKVLPQSIYIAKLDKTVDVLNPISRSVADLDTALLGGVVRHPDSATLDREGNVFILGHSSYLPNVLNKNYQALNGIQNLQWGDTIEVSGGDKTYVYRVEKVYKAKASELVVPIADTGNMLTLATCNSFGSADDRYIVEASRQVVRSS